MSDKYECECGRVFHSIVDLEACQSESHEGNPFSITPEVMRGALVPRQETRELQTWGGAAERGLEARREREKIISKVLLPDIDYGTVPGVPKPFLFKSGAEKVIDALNLRPMYEEMNGTVIDFSKPRWCFRYRCRLLQRGSGIEIAEGVGSCNSYETKYRYRKEERTCPKCGKQGAIIKGKEEYGGGWLCWAKREGCGAKFSDNAPEIVGQEVGQVDNPDVMDQLNTGDKMAQKRALVAAALNLGFSDTFTQDPEMLGASEPDDAPRSTPAGEAPKAGDAEYQLDMSKLI